MIFQNFIYGLFIFEIKDQIFFFFSEFKLGLKKKGVRFMVRVWKFVLQGVQNNFFKKYYIYI